MTQMGNFMNKKKEKSEFSKECEPVARIKRQNFNFIFKSTWNSQYTLIRKRFYAFKGYENFTLEINNGLPIPLKNHQKYL